MSEIRSTEERIAELDKKMEQIKAQKNGNLTERERNTAKSAYQKID